MGLSGPHPPANLVFSVYQGVCFPIYGIPKVRRRDYILLDRRHLAYLNWVEKLNCEYCGLRHRRAGVVRGDPRPHGAVLVPH